MDSLAGQQLMKADGSTHKADEVMADVELILYYFSAHWCPPCKQFTPMLKDFYNEVSEDKVAVVFVSSDRGASEMFSYMKESHGDWFATEHGSQLSNDLKQKYGIRGIPTLVVCKKDGTVVTKEGRGAVMSTPPAQAVKSWKS